MLKAGALGALLASVLLVAVACARGEGALPATPTPTPSLTATAEAPALVSPTPPGTAVALPSPSPQGGATPPSSVMDVEPPERDLKELARRLRGVSLDEQASGIPTLPSTQPGQSATFWLVDLDTSSTRQVQATLIRVSDHAYWYFEEGARIPRDSALDQAVETFQGQLVPLESRVLGGLWTPGPNGDPRLTLLHVRIQGAGGYFSASDQYPATVHPFSNERAMIYLNTDAFSFGSRQYLGTLAHELQHAIHWAADPTEEVWVNEGLSEVMTALAGYRASFTGPFDGQRSSTSLIFWPTEPQQTLPFYGAATRFFQFLLHQYGGADTLARIVGQPGDGIAGLEAFLHERGSAETFDELFQRWAVANALALPTGPYSYGETAISPLVPTAILSGLTTYSGRAPQYAAQYLRVTGSAPALLRFQGDQRTPLFPDPPPTPSCWWSNRGDSIDSTLTRPLDLRPVMAAKLELTLWYDLEEGWDYAYVEVSADGGATWELLAGARTARENPVGNAFGPGYTGRSNGWVKDTFDLAKYAGKGILLRMEYVTDEAISGEGLCLAEAAVPEIDFRYQATEPGDWAAEGFVFSDYQVPQPYAVQVVLGGESPEVYPLLLAADNTGSLLLKGLGTQYNEALVVITPLGRRSSQLASYTVTLEGVP